MLALPALALTQGCPGPSSWAALWPPVQGRAAIMDGGQEVGCSDEVPTGWAGGQKCDGTSLQGRAWSPVRQAQTGGGC